MDSGHVFSRIRSAFEAGEIPTACAWCGRVQVDDDWLPIPPAVVAALNGPQAFTHSICGSCFEAYTPQTAPPS
jgi:hypothetical protein